MAEIKPKTMNLTSGQTVLIRNAVPLDAALIIEFVKEALTDADWSVTQSHEFTLPLETEISLIEEYLISPGRLILIAEANGQIVAHLQFTNGMKERNRHVGTIGMSVREGLRGSGIGSALLQILLEWAKQNPIIEKVSLEVFHTNERAIKLYRNMGFIEEGFKAREYRLSEEKYIDSILMYQMTRQN